MSIPDLDLNDPEDIEITNLYEKFKNIKKKF